MEIDPALIDEVDWSRASVEQVQSYVDWLRPFEGEFLLYNGHWLRGYETPGRELSLDQIEDGMVVAQGGIYGSNVSFRVYFRDRTVMTKAILSKPDLS